RDMLDSLRGAALLHGARGKPPVDIEAVIDAMLAIGGQDGLLMQHRDDIASLDINPLIATPAGCIAVDARVLLQPALPESVPASGSAPAASLARLLHPESIAVVGVSSDGRGSGNAFIRHLRSFGFSGKLFIVHPSASEIDGFACYPSLCVLPLAVVYAYIPLPSARYLSVRAAVGTR